MRYMHKRREFPTQRKAGRENVSGRAPLRTDRVANFSGKAWKISFILFLCIAAIWSVYLLVGQQLIGGLYGSAESRLASRLMAGRNVTPVEAYFRRADELLLNGTGWLVAGYVAALLLLRNALGWLLFALSLLSSSFLLFVWFETFPVMIKTFHLDAVSGYYAYKVNYLPDPELGFREKPFNRRMIHGFAGTQYSPRYGIEVAPVSIEWIMDQDGFRNGEAADSADVVVLGDSYLEYGDVESDTFVGRLGQKLGALTVRNLGKSGYAPFQYLEVLKRFGLKYKPKYAIMVFYEGNDIQEVRDYLLWKNGKTNEGRGYLFKFATGSLVSRYWAAADATWFEMKRGARALEEIILHKLARVRGYGHSVHPDIAILNLGGRTYAKLFIDKFAKTTTAEMLRTDEFRALKESFGAFREVCEDNGIKPVIVYIPAAWHIYAEYSTRQSGMNWLNERDTQITASEFTEDAVTTVAHEVNIELISLSPTFRRAAKEGKMIYYPLDAHWNAEGREIAADFVAETLRSRYLDLPSKQYPG